MLTIELIQNINTLFKPKLMMQQERFYLEFLSRYTNNQLEELWNVTIESHLRTSPPTIGELKKYAKDLAPLIIINHEDIQKKLTDEEIFSTDLGRLSLQQGWARTYLMRCREKGIPDQSDKTLLAFQVMYQGGSDAALSIKDDTHSGSQSLMRLWQTMIQANLDLKEKYRHLWEVPVQQIT